MKICLFMILYLYTTPSIFPMDAMTHTFKSHNFRIQIPADWKVEKFFGKHKNKPILKAHSKEEGIHLEIYAKVEKETDLKAGFNETLKRLDVWTENHTTLALEVEFPLYNLKGYWGKISGYREKRKINGYLVYATDGVNVFTIHSYTDANLFPKNFKTMKRIYKDFQLNRNFKNECCFECTNIAPKSNEESNLGCSAFTYTVQCLAYFRNQPRTVGECR